MSSVSDRILQALLDRGDMTRTEIRDLFGRNKSAAVISEALGSLLDRGLARRRCEETGGRPREIWAIAYQGPMRGEAVH